MTTAATAPATQIGDDEKIVCHIDGKRVHSILIYIRDHHPDWTIDRYQKEFPGEPIVSEFVRKRLEAKAKAKATAAAAEAPLVANLHGAGVMVSKPMHEVFDLGPAKAARNSAGEPIMITVFEGASDENAALIPDIDEKYIFDIEALKNVLIGMQIGKTQYNWGLHGTGKTTLFEQVCARTGRPFMRVQHTASTEASHIVGQFIVKDGATQFQLGPLAVAMIEGQVYCADEYDFGMPNVLAAYQPVLEGKPLIIMDAPPELRVIRPHKDFRFVATGNTNGGGDETGLYQGTLMQNAANYSRFNIVQEIGYMDKKTEIAVVSGQSGCDKDVAQRIVEFAKSVRDEFKNGRIGSTISPRELINAAQLGIVRGGDWKVGLRLGFTARLSRTDKEVVEQFAQRIFG